MSRRKFYPNWYVPNLKGPGHLERCTADPGPDAIANTTDFELTEMLFEPFDLTKKHHIPNAIDSNFGYYEPSRKRKANPS